MLSNGVREYRKKEKVVVVDSIKMGRVKLDVFYYSNNYLYLKKLVIVVWFSKDRQTTNVVCEGVDLVVSGCESWWQPVANWAAAAESEAGYVDNETQEMQNGWTIIFSRWIWYKMGAGNAVVVLTIIIAFLIKKK